MTTREHLIGLDIARRNAFREAADLAVEMASTKTGDAEEALLDLDIALRRKARECCAETNGPRQSAATVGGGMDAAPEIPVAVPLP